MDEPKLTPRACEACGGRGCKWCTDGFQDQEQQTDWRKFRQKMRRISGTYSMLENLVRELVKRMEEIGTEESLKVAERGRSCLHRWIMAEPDTAERRDASVDMNIFQKDALLVLMKKRQGS